MIPLAGRAQESFPNPSRPRAILIDGSILTYGSLNNTMISISGRSELHVTAAADPIPGCLISLNSPDAWLFLENVQPSLVISNHLGQIQVNGAPAVLDGNVRVVEYAIEPVGMGPPLREIDFLIPRRELRYNHGMETVARAPANSHLQGARIVIAERSIDEDGNLFAAILEGPERGLFFVARSDGFDVTDGVFLPDGDLLLLERRFSLATGVAMRIRRIAGEDIRAGVLVDGMLLHEADMTHQIDNMESIDWWRRDDGALVIALMSDDNQSILQRTLYLEFVLVGE